MWISGLDLTHFRNYKKLSLDLQKTVYFIVGKNGQGKTNILEAIALGSLAKSFRNADIRDTIQRESEFFRLSFTVEQEKEKLKLEEYVENKTSASVSRTFWKNKVEVGLEDYLATLKIVVFSPENINLLLLGPSERRKYLNFLLLQNFPKKFSLISDYNQVLANRNALLYRIRKGYTDKRELAFWDIKLLALGEEIIQLREDVVLQLNKNFERFFQEISHSKAKAQVVYKPNIPKEDFAAKLSELEDADIEKGLTQCGPHRDNLEIHVGGLDILSFGSRGELRTALLAMKFAECKMFEEDKAPVLLLDDVFSELDAKRRQKVLELSRPYQTFITTCELEDLPESREDTQTLFVNDAEVKKS
jgi:DNA replication and repair protein RecF